MCLGGGWSISHDLKGRVRQVPNKSTSLKVSFYLSKVSLSLTEAKKMDFILMKAMKDLFSEYTYNADQYKHRL